MPDLQTTIEQAFEHRADITPQTVTAETRDAIIDAIEQLDQGHLRVAEKRDGQWVVNQWLKKAVLLSFRLNPMEVIKGGPGEAVWWDKVPSKFDGWSANEFEKAGFRSVPGAVVRRSAYLAPGVVLMPSFVNLGARVESGTMVDTWATVGSCAQIGRNVHISGGAGIGGVLEPLQANPVIIEDNCFIGARAEVAFHRRVQDGDGGHPHEHLRHEDREAAQPEQPHRQRHDPQRRGRFVDRDRVRRVGAAEEEGLPVLRAGLGRGRVERVRPAVGRQVPVVQRSRPGKQYQQSGTRPVRLALRSATRRAGQVRPPRADERRAALAERAQGLRRAPGRAAMIDEFMPRASRHLLCPRCAMPSPAP